MARLALHAVFCVERFVCQLRIRGDRMTSEALGRFRRGLRQTFCLRDSIGCVARESFIGHRVFRFLPDAKLIAGALRLVAHGTDLHANIFVGRFIIRPAPARQKQRAHNEHQESEKLLHWLLLSVV